MENIIYEVLSLIETNGFEAYIVGGYIRDKILGIDSKDIDIITNAKPKDLFNIFKNNVKVKEEYGSVKLIINEYNIDITTYRKDYNYINNKPTKVEYITDVFEDLKRRDFTINTLLMNKNGKIIDLTNAIKDIYDGRIKIVGDIKTKFDEDSTRILRALRFMTVLNFKLDNDITNYIVKYKSKIEKISYNKKKEELEKIFVSKNLRKFVSYIKKYKLEEVLNIKIDKIVFVPNVIGIWAQIEFDKNYPFTRNERKQIEDLKYLINKKNITIYDIYKFGNYITMTATMIMKKNPKRINKIYTNLPIKDIIDINISADEICEILQIKPSKKIKEIYETLEKNILDGKVKNIKEELVNYIKEKELKK